MKDPKQCTGMIDIREAIDSIDNQIVKLISQRAEYVNEAAKFKKDATAVKDSQRVTKVINSKKELAIKYGTSPELVGNIYKMMIDYFIDQEMKEFNENQ